MSPHSHSSFGLRNMDSTTFSSSYRSIAIATLSLLLITKLMLSFITKKTKKYPPSPLSLPIIGHLYLFKKPLHRALAGISARQGNAPALLLRFGSRPVLVVSSRHLADECFTKNDLAFANRPHLPSLKRISYDHSTFDNLNYGPHWRNLRRVAIVSGLSAHRLNSFSHFRASEIHALARGLFRDYKASAGQMHRVADLRERLFELSIKNIMTMVLGKRYYDEERSEKARRFQECIEEVFEVSGASNVADFVPLLGKLDVNGLQKKLLQLGKHRDEALQALLDEEKRKQSGGGKELVEGEGEDKKKSMIAELVELQRAEPDFYTDQIIKALISTLLSAGTHSTSNTIEWGMSLLVNHPDKLKKAQAEIDGRVNDGRILSESDVSNLPYLQCIVNEVLRLYAGGPLLVPHESSQDCVVGGYDIPKGTMLLVNAYAIHRDPKIWDEPEKFVPERFADFKGVEGDKMIITFGMGRRSCAGEGLARRVVSLVVGTLIQCFEWERVGKELLDMTEGPGLTLPKVVPFEAMYRPRQAMVGALSEL